MPGTPTTSPVFGAPRYSNADGADFAGQVNGVTDIFDANAVKTGSRASLQTLTLTDTGTNSPTLVINNSTGQAIRTYQTTGQVAYGNRLASGDANPAFSFTGAGTLAWGPGGAAATDTTLARTGVGALTLTGALTASSTLALNGAPTLAGVTIATLATSSNNIIRNVLAAGDTAAAFQINGVGSHYWGPGGTTAWDTNLYRAGVGSLKTDTAFSVGGNLTVGSPTVTGVSRIETTSINISGSAAPNEAFRTMVTGDTQPRHAILCSGVLTWGPGNSGADTNLYRLGVGSLKTDTAFSVGGTLTGSSTARFGSSGANVGPVSGRLGLIGGNAAAGVVEVWNALSVDNANSWGSFVNPGAGGIYASGSATIGGAVSVGGNLTTGSSSTIASSGGNLYVQAGAGGTYIRSTSGAAVVIGDTNANGVQITNAGGPTTIGGTLTVTGLLSANGGLSAGSNGINSTGVIYTGPGSTSSAGLHPEGYVVVNPGPGGSPSNNDLGLYTNTGALPGNSGNYPVVKTAYNNLYFSVAGVYSAYMTSDGVMHSMSSRGSKQKLVALDFDDVLERIGRLDLQEWEFKTNPGVRRIGPFAEDFHEQFGLGEHRPDPEDREHPEHEAMIAPADVAGVALAGVKALLTRLDGLESRLATT